jgi:hypothetical protein
MKRLVFTIVAGFIGGSGYGDELGPLQLEGAEHARPRRASGEHLHRPVRHRAHQPDLAQQSDAARSNAGVVALPEENQGLA